MAYIERVIILATLPTQCVSEMTWPTTEERSLTLTILQSTLRISLILLFNLDFDGILKRKQVICQRSSLAGCFGSTGISMSETELCSYFTASFNLELRS